MTEKNHKNLRVFCLCGQKMQVTQDMYGRPAKCVACHQKWFIPEKEEIPDAIESLNLKEHPELLRLPGQYFRSSAGINEEKPSTKAYFKTTHAPITDINISGNDASRIVPNKKNDAIAIEEPAGEEISALEETGGRAPEVILNKTPKIPLEPFEPLRLLFGYTEELHKRREHLGEATEDSDKRQTLETYDHALQRTLHKILHSLKLEQQSTERQIVLLDDEIARLNIALRVGDCHLDGFLSQMADLRRHRESLERHNHNLLAWRELKDPFMAGGVNDVSLESFHEQTFEIYVPVLRMINADKPLFVHYGDELREILQMRTALERRKAEWAHMVAEDDYSAASVQEGLVETEAALKRNTACMRFCYQRIEQLSLDCDNDLKSLAKYKEDVLDRAAKKQLRENILHDLLDSIEKANNDITRMKGLIRQSLSANSPMEVPMPSSTLVQRLRGAIEYNAFSADTTLFGGATILIIAGLLMFTEKSTADTDWLAVLCTCVIIGIVAFGVVLDRKLRAPVLMVSWLLLLGLLISFVYFRTSMDKYLLLFSENGNVIPPFINIRAWLLVAGAALTGAGTAVAIADYQRLRGRTYLNFSALLVFCTVISGAAIATVHTVAPRTAALNIEISEYLDEKEGYQNTYPLTDENLLPEMILDGNAPDSPTISIEEGESAENMSMFLMQGVMHGEGSMPRFRASISHPDGSIENLSLKLGDSISGEWKAQEYNRYTKKLTISNGERLLVLEAGEQVPLPVQPIKAS